VANATGLFAARGLEAQGAQPALTRGTLSLGAVWLFGLLGAGYWLYPESWLWFAGVGALGLAGGALGPAAVTLGARRQGRPLRDTLEGLRCGVAPAAVTSFGFGLACAAFVVSVIAVVGFASAQAGACSPTVGAARAALVVAAFAAAAWAPYAHAVEAAASLAESARRMAAMAGVEGDAPQRLQRMADSQAVAGALSRCHASFAAGAIALAAGLMATPFPPEPGVVTLMNGWIPLLGAAWVLAGAASAARRTARAARETSLEVERQLATGPAEIPAGERGPSYRGCEETAARAGISGAFTGGLGALFGPVVLGIALKVVYRGSDPRLAAEAFATFVAGAAVTALGGALTVDGARAVLTGARRANRPEADPATYAASVTGDALSEILGNAVGPAAYALSLVAAALSLFATIIFR